MLSLLPQLLKQLNRPHEAVLQFSWALDFNRGGPVNQVSGTLVREGGGREGGREGMEGSREISLIDRVTGGLHVAFLPTAPLPGASQVAWNTLLSL